MIRLIIAVLLICVAMPAAADELRPGYLEFSQHSAQDWQLVWKAPMKGGITPATAPILPRGCKVQGEPRREIVDIFVVSRSAVQCSGDVGGGRIGLANLEGSQTDVLARVAPLGRPVQVLRLTASSPVGQIAERSSRWQVARTYFVTGIEHILFGYDHLLFVVALVLLLERLIAVAKAVTAFTVAHSITLVGTTLGLLGLPQNPVESVIALSIIFLAVEIAKRVPGQPRLSERVPWVVAFLFGLLHGFGFAGALKEIGLPEGEVPMALLTFNVGVEVGQLAIVVATLAILATLTRFAPRLRQPSVRLATLAIGVTASFWFFERTFV
ncbi:MAG: HupE/UreJ family protein [Proteobacteria bacterium]|nr:HupE/UreJ family protein [Pseudomonadota bacterium]